MIGPFRLLLPLVALTLAACAPRPVVEPLAPPVDAPENFPLQDYRSLPADEVLRIDSATSIATVLVTRDGPLARFGHDHIVASRSIHGFVWLPGSQLTSGARTDLYLPLIELAVDEPALRASAGLDTAPTADDIAGTRANMHKSLATDRYPWLILSATLNEAGALDANLELHGIAVPYAIPVELEYTEERLIVRGAFTLVQTDHGITPFSALGGALSVGDELTLEFELQAN